MLVLSQMILGRKSWLLASKYSPLPYSFAVLRRLGCVWPPLPLSHVGRVEGPTRPSGSERSRRPELRDPLRRRPPDGQTPNTTLPRPNHDRSRVAAVSARQRSHLSRDKFQSNLLLPRADCRDQVRYSKACLQSWIFRASRLQASGLGISIPISISISSSTPCHFARQRMDAGRSK